MEDIGGAFEVGYEELVLVLELEDGEERTGDTTGLGEEVFGSAGADGDEGTVAAGAEATDGLVADEVAGALSLLGRPMKKTGVETMV